MAATDLFRSMIAYWKEFDLQKVQEELDRTASVLAVQCEETDVSRQLLLQKSREFKRNSSEEVQRATAPLLKCFQTEIDGLLRRSKLAESAFLAIYKKLTQMPDVMPVLVAAEQLQLEVERLRGCFTESLQQKKESVNNRNRCRCDDEKSEEKDCDNLTCGLVSSVHKDSYVEIFSGSPTHLQQNQMPPETPGEVEPEVPVYRPSGDGMALVLQNLQPSSMDIDYRVESVRSSNGEDLNTNALVSETDDCAAMSSGVDLRCHEGQREQNVHTRRGNAVVSRHEDGLSQYSTVALCACDVVTTNHEDDPSRELVASGEDAGCCDVNHKCLALDASAAKDDGEAMVPNYDIIWDKGENRCVMPDDYRLNKYNQTGGAATPNDCMIHDAVSASNNVAVPSGLLRGNSKVPDDALTDDETVSECTEERDVHLDLPAEVMQDGDDFHVENAEVMQDGDDFHVENEERTLDLRSSSCHQEGIQREHTMDFHEKWHCEQESAKQSSEKMDLSVNNLSKMEDFASQIGQEIVTSFHNSSSSSQFPQPQLWHPDGTIAKSESFSFLAPAAHLHSHMPSYPTDLSASHLDLTPEGMKVEGGDETATTPLDTLEVARHIREILSFHNLGQRLFARYVLGLSQGTVSELLSKPKHWEKLTEKGRDSYRKMNQWASDERNIQTLKSLSSPKCSVSSSSSSLSTTSVRGVDPVAEERIAQILSEAQAAMQLKQEITTEQYHHQNGLSAPRMFETYSRPPVNQAEQERALPRKSKANRKTGGPASSSRNEALKNRKVESEHLTREIVARIYQEQLEKLAQVAETSGNVVELLSYRQELARLSQGWARRPAKPDGLKEDKENRDETIDRPKKLGNDGAERPPEFKMDVDLPQDLSVNGSTEMLHPTPEASALPSVKVGFSSSPVLTVSPGSGLLSPLQRMQSIANSLMLQNPSSSSQNPQPARTVLPPISQEQFDLYANISTDELVKRVRDVLSQYSISQRLFGEFVLGLSQGSVSDLLARPKPWHLLTQKGREPFIRMQMFVDDSEAVQRLVASQYRVPTEKLYSNSSPLDDRSGGMANESSTEVTDLPDFPAKTASRSSTPFHSPTASLSACDATQPRSDALSSAMFSSASTSPSRSDAIPSAFDKSLTTGVGFPSMGVAMVPSVLSLFSATFLPSNPFGPLMNVDLHHLYGPGIGAGSSAMPTTQTPDLGGAAELDTQAVTARVKEVLQVNNLGQKLFGEAVLELSQGSVSELLSKPKPWHMLSLKGREPFVKMQIWLSDPLGVQKLHAYQTHMAGRKRRSSCEGLSVDKPGSQKKPRLFFSEEQKEALRAAYQRDPYPNQLAIEQLASDLDIGVKTVINWFHNHRMRAKQHQTCNSPTSTTAGSPSCSALARVKAETPEDVPENAIVGTTRWMSYPLEESMTHVPLRSKCDSATPRSDGRVERHSVNDDPGKSFCSPSANNNSAQSKRHELNKRKRARPHRLYSGTAAAGEIQVTREFQATEEMPDAREFRASSADVAIDLSIGRSSEIAQTNCTAASTENQRACETGKQCKLLKSCDGSATLPKPVVTDGCRDIKRESSEDWNHRIKNIEKLQQNLLLATSDEWEF